MVGSWRLSERLQGCTCPNVTHIVAKTPRKGRAEDSAPKSFLTICPILPS